MKKTKLLETLLRLFLGTLCTLPSSAQTLDLAGIAHVAFRVTNYEEARRFYVTLGFEQAFEFADPGKPRVSYIKVNDQQFVELYEKSGDSQPGLMHICFAASEIESLRSFYVQSGLSLTEAKKFRAGNLLFTMHDPGGQLLEYTQYLPGSLHSLDRGKHLGSKRIADHLLGSSTPAPDLEAERQYYISKLGFRPMDAAGILLRLPGDSGQWIELQPAAGSRPRIGFMVENLGEAKKSLRQRKIRFEKQGDSISVTDPDGTTLTFAAH